MANTKNIMYWVIGFVVVLLIVAFIIFKPSFSKKGPMDKRTLDGITLSGISIKEENKVYTYRANVKATRDVNINYVKITVTKNGKKTELVGYIGKDLKKNDEAYITSSTDVDITNPEKIEYTIVNK